MMTKNEYAHLYMDVFENGFVNDEYKEKFKRLMNYNKNRCAKLEILLKFITNTFCENSNESEDIKNGNLKYGSFKPIDTSKYNVTESGNVVKEETHKSPFFFQNHMLKYVIL